MSILSNDVNRLERFLNDGMNSLFRLSVMVVGIGVLLFWINWQLALVALLPVPIIGGFTYLFIKIIQPKYAEVRSSVGKMNSRLENNLGGIQVIKSSNTEPYESDRVDDVSMDYFDANWDAITTRDQVLPGSAACSPVSASCSRLSSVGSGCFRTLRRARSPATSRSGCSSSSSSTPSGSSGRWRSSGRSSSTCTSARLLRADLRADGRAVATRRGPRRRGSDRRRRRRGLRRRELRLRRRETIVSDIDFAVGGGETLALVGPTGAGKSTVLKLLLRMYDVDEGSIRIDGQDDVRDVTLKSLRRSIGYVGQSSYLFYGTIRENITYGTFEATDEEVREAAEAAEAHEFIKNLPEGYDTMVGERGVKLSGGQRQRVTIARAVLKDPDLLILDEATSDVDTETEMLIQRSLDRLTADRTTFAIAHRLSTIKDADTILVRGRRDRRARPTTVRQQRTVYAHLWGVQAGEIDELPQEFIDRAQERTARLVEDAESDDD